MACPRSAAGVVAVVLLLAVSVALLAVFCVNFIETPTPVFGQPDNATFSLAESDNATRLRGSRSLSVPSPAPAALYSPPSPAPLVPAAHGSRLEWQWGFDSTYCMSVDGNEFRNGQGMQLWLCSGSSGQYFDWDAHGFVKVAARPEYCVTAEIMAGENGARILLGTCDASNLAQQWVPHGKDKANGGLLISSAAFPDKCLVVGSNYEPHMVVGDAANGQQLRLGPCSGGEYFKTWTTSSTSAPTPAPWYPPTPAPTGPPELYWGSDSSYCMSVDGNEFKNGQGMQLWKCSGSSGQHFDWDQVGFPGFPASSPLHSVSAAQGFIKVSASPEYCVVIDGNKNYDGARIQLWNCDENVLAQQWVVVTDGASNVDGTTRWKKTLIRNAAFLDKCLVVDSNKGANGRGLQLWSCSGDEQYKTWGQSV